MLDNIKSIYFIKIIFIHIADIRKLQLIKYNKNLQQKINISLINYKIFSGSNIVFERNGKGKEYSGYNDNLIFEG